MKNIKAKILSVVLTLAIAGSLSMVSAVAVGEDELTGDNNIVTDQPVVDTPVVDEPDYVDPGYSEPSYDEPVVDTPVVDTPVVDTPVVDEPDYVEPDYSNPSYDDPNNNTGDYSDDYSDDTTDDYYSDDSDNQINYDADYYHNYYDQGYDNSFQSQEIYDENGNSYNDFERATDYNSASVDTDNVVDMYNSNGSDDNTLTSDDWAEIKLNLGTNSAKGTGDFSFIKDNKSEQDSNLSVLLLIFGIVFVVSSVAMLVYLFVSSKKYKKLSATSNSTARVHHSTVNDSEEDTYDINNYINNYSSTNADYDDDF